MNGTQDLLVKKLAGEVCDSDFPIPLSHEIGTIVMLARENETFLSSAILKIADSAYGIWLLSEPAQGVRGGASSRTNETSWRQTTQGNILSSLQCGFITDLNINLAFVKKVCGDKSA